MSDNVAITAGSGTTIAADEVVDGTLGTVKVQYVKIMDATLDGTTKAAVGAAGLKVDGSGATQPVSGTFWQATQPVSAASLPLPTGASTAAKQPALGTAGSASTDVLSVQGIASMTALKVDGSAVTQPVSGTVTANIGTSGSLALDATITGGTQQTKITDGTNIATVKAASTAAVAADKAVVVAISPNNSVTVSSTQGTAAAVTAGWPTISGQPADTTGTFTNGTQTTSVTTGTINGYETVTVSINGTYGTATAVFEVSDDAGTTWYGAQGARSDSATIESGYTTLTNTTRMWVIPINGADQFRVRSTAVASGTVNVRVSPTSAATADSAIVSLGSALPAGSAVIGHVIADSGSTTAVTGNVTVVQGTGSNLHAVLDTGSTTAVTQATGTNLHTVVDSGTITANIGTSGSLALDATLTGGSAKTKLVDSGGTNVGTIKAASTAAGATDTALVVAVSPNNSVAVTGTFWQATQPVSGTVTTSPPSNASSNVAQINAVTPLMGNGVTGTGSLRVTVASDNTAFSVNAVQSGTWNIGTVTTLPALPSNQSVNVSQINAVTPLMGNGVTGTGSQRVTIASDNTAFSVNAVQSGTWNVGTVTTVSTVSAVTAISNALPAGTNLMGKVGIDQTTAGTTNGVVENATSASGGITTTTRLMVAAASTNATSAKASAGRLYSIQGYNAATTPRYLKLYNKASSPTVGSDTPVKTMALPPGVGFAFDWPIGYYFSTGISFALTVGAADADTAALTLADVLGLNLDYV